MRNGQNMPTTRAGLHLRKFCGYITDKKSRPTYYSINCIDTGDSMLENQGSQLLSLNQHDLKTK